MKKLDDIYVCIDCHQLLETGDYTFFDGSYEPEKAEERIYECETGIVRLMDLFGKDSKLYSSGKEIEFSHFPCQCCYNKDSGERYRFIVYE